MDDHKKAIILSTSHPIWPPMGKKEFWIGWIAQNSKPKLQRNDLRMVLGMVSVINDPILIKKIPILGSG